MNVEQSPRFSFIIPAYNAADTLAAAVTSALSQMVGSLEVIISDDGSTDATASVADRLQLEDGRVRIVSGPNAGCAAARNRGIELARGEFFCLLDADDLLESTYLEHMSAFVRANPGRDIYSCNATRRLVSGRSEAFFSGDEFSRETSWTLDDLIPVDRIYVSALVRRELWQRLGGFRTDLRYAEDYDFWLRALAAGAGHRYLPERLGIAVARLESKSRNRVPHARAQIRIFEDLAGTDSLTLEQRRACAEKLNALQRRIERVELERRLQQGEYAGARAAYLRVRSAYLSRGLYYTGLALMLVSPRLYAAAYRRRSSWAT
jgi:glycosyltransferase involved in cell wall biosynthesis